MEGIIDYTLGVYLCVAYSGGAVLGAQIAIRKGSRWLKTVFLVAALLLALQIVATELAAF